MDVVNAWWIGPAIIFGLFLMYYAALHFNAWLDRRRERKYATKSRRYGKKRRAPAQESNQEAYIVVEEKKQSVYDNPIHGRLDLSLSFPIDEDRNI